MQIKNFHRAIIASLVIAITLATVLSITIVVEHRTAQNIPTMSALPVQIAMADTLPKACRMISTRVAPTVESPSIEVRECR